MKLPLRPSLLKIRRESVKYIIIHHTSELYDQPLAKIDNQKYQLSAIMKSILEQKTIDFNYHYIIEKVKEDYIPMVCRPLPYLCEWDDIKKEINNRSIHIAMLGNYDLQIATKREYEVLVYRLINPLLNLYKIPPSRVYLHRDISNDKTLTCPGDFFEKTILESMIRRFVIK